MNRNISDGKFQQHFYAKAKLKQPRECFYCGDDKYS